MLLTSIGVSAKEVVTNGTFSDTSSTVQTGWSAYSMGDFFSGNAYYDTLGGTLSQTFSGLSGLITLSFTYAADGGTLAQEEVQWNGNSIALITGAKGTPSPLLSTYLDGVTYTYTFNASGTGSDTLTFHSLVKDAQYIRISNVSVKDTTPVPEPSTYAMLLAGLALTAAARRRRG